MLRSRGKAWAFRFNWISSRSASYSTPTTARQPGRRICFHILLLGCLLICGSQQASALTCHTFYTVIANFAIPEEPFIPVLEDVKVSFFVNSFGEVISFYKFSDHIDVYDNGQLVKVLPEDASTPCDSSTPAQARSKPSIAASTLSSPTGQANEMVAQADFNGDGIIDSAVLTGSGVIVTLLNADGTTLSTSSYLIPGVGPSIVSADFNGDKFADLAVTETDPSGQGNVVILLGKGDGTFGTQSKYPAGPGAGFYGFYLATGDFNRDGVPDLAVTNSAAKIGSNTTVSVLLGKGDGAFAAPVPYTVGEFPATIVAADFNGDGIVDLATLDSQTGFTSYTNKVWVLPGKGDGTFLPAKSTPSGTGSGYLSYADLNNDGKLDLIIADQLASSTAIMMGNGDGTFQGSTEYLMSAQPVSIAPIPRADGNTWLTTVDTISPALFSWVVGRDGTVYIPAIQSLGTGPTWIATPDLNGDQKPDLVISDPEAGNIYVELATGGGQFGPPATYPLGSQPSALDIADLNGDGKLDVVAADATGIDVLLGTGSGALGPVKTFASNAGLSSVAIADFNSDGKPDVVAASPSGGDVALFLGNGNGTFQSVRTIALSGGLVPLRAIAGDFNGDGKPDMAVAFSPTDFNQPGGIAVFLGKGDGTFQPPNNIMLTGPLASAALLAADFNGDGKLDLVTVIRGSGSNQVAVFLGNGDGTFLPPILASTTTAPPMLVTTDQNVDGKLDLLLADCCGLSEASVLLGNGDGSFQPEFQIPSGANPRGVASADFNGDGALDVAIIGQVQRPDRGTLVVMFNPNASTGTTAPSTTTAASVSATYSQNSQSITLSATVSSNSTPISGGSVTFTLLSTSVSANVVSGTASTSFTIPAGTAAGSYQIQASYNPASGYSASSDTSHQLTISKANPVITWATPASIVAGTPLGSTQLDATANVAGALAYTPPAGTVLAAGNNQTLSVLFTPANTTDYTTQTATVQINVTPPPPVLAISKSHTTTFKTGGTGSYTVTVSNPSSAGPTSGTVTVADKAPAGMTVTAMSGGGWNCVTLPTCTRSDALQPGQSYSSITVSVSVASNAPSSLTNMATVSGGGSASATASDITSIGSATEYTFSWTANPAAGGSVTPASGSLYAPGSKITVNAVANACYQFSTYSGALSGKANPASLTMNASESVTANFVSTAEASVSGQLQSALSGYRYNRLTGTYSQGLTVTNSGAAISGPLYLVLDSLTAGATLVGSQGHTQCALPAGSPYILLTSGGIGAGQSLTFRLQFSSASGPPPFIYTPRYLAGSGLQ